MTDLKPQKISVAHIVIAILVLVVIFQAAILIAQHKRQTGVEKNLTEAIPAVQMPSPALAKAPLSHHPAALGAQNAWDADPFEEFDAMSRRLSNMMRQAYIVSAPIMQSLNTRSGLDFTPAVDLEETDKSYIVRSDLPGLDKDKISITVKNNILTLEGMRQSSSETKDPQKGYYAQERSYGSFARSLSLPGPVDETKVTAQYENGVLTVTLPKAPEQKDFQKVAIQ